MDGFWVDVLVAVLAGAVSAGTMFVLFNRKSARPAPEVVESPPSCTGPAPQPRPDPWLEQLHRCEQAVYRAYRAVDSVSSTRARNGLQAVVRRMEAELPDVRALVELGRGLGEERGNAAARVRQQLEDASVRFLMVTDNVLEMVVELVAAPDLNRVNQQVTVLREQFPLLRPMSAVLAPSDAKPLQRS